MRSARLLVLFAFALLYGPAEAATFGPPAPPAGAEFPPPDLAFPVPAALGSPCPDTLAAIGWQPMAFTLDLFSTGPSGYALVGPSGYDTGVLGMICRLTAFPLGRK